MAFSRWAAALIWLFHVLTPVSADVAQSIAHSTIFTRADGIQAQTYDYIIVGGGTSGLTVADRLTEDGNFSVLVIEEGIFQNSSNVTTVATGDFAFLDPTLHFNFSSVPQPGLNGRTVVVLTAAMLGGSSGHNAMIVHRGQREDYNRWASYFGPDSSQWTWDDLLPYFKKAWNFHPPDPALAEAFNMKIDPSFWGNTSNIHASFPDFQWPFLRTEMNAFGEIPGVEFPPDSGSGIPGAFWFPTSAIPGVWTRSFARTGHWDGISMTRSNYHTLVAHKVLKVTLEQGRATGVMFVPANATDMSSILSATARKEVILAAGSIHTPQVLQGSGIGPSALLESAGIEVLVDLPGVGSNFQDHGFVVSTNYNLTKFNVSPEPSDLFTNQTFVTEVQAEFAANRTGPLQIAAGNAAAFFPLPVIAPDAFQQIADEYEAQDPAAFLPAGTDATVIQGYQVQKAALAASMRSNEAAFYNQFIRGGALEGGIIDFHPVSRGTVTINPEDPFFAQPIVDFRALSNPIDGDIMAAITRFNRRYWFDTSLNAFGPVELWPGINVTTTADIIAAVREMLVPSAFHYIGTSARMPRELGGVVDEQLLVYGVEGLSVVDASTMPDMPGAYTQQTTYAQAEKAADLIKARA